MSTMFISAGWYSTSMPFSERKKLTIINWTIRYFLSTEDHFNMGVGHRVSHWIHLDFASRVEGPWNFSMCLLYKFTGLNSVLERSNRMSDVLCGGILWMPGAIFNMHRSYELEHWQQQKKILMTSLLLTVFLVLLFFFLSLFAWRPTTITCKFFEAPVESSRGCSFCYFVTSRIDSSW